MAIKTVSWLFVPAAGGGLQKWVPSPAASSMRFHRDAGGFELEVFVHDKAVLHLRLQNDGDGGVRGNFDAGAAALGVDAHRLHLLLSAEPPDAAAFADLIGFTLPE